MKLLRWISLATVLALLATGLSLGALAEAANEEIYEITVGDEGRVVVRASGAWDAEGQLPAGVRTERGRSYWRTSLSTAGSAAEMDPL